QQLSRGPHLIGQALRRDSPAAMHADRPSGSSGTLHLSMRESHRVSTFGLPPFLKRSPWPRGPTRPQNQAGSTLARSATAPQKELIQPATQHPHALPESDSLGGLSPSY